MNTALGLAGSVLVAVLTAFGQILYKQASLLPLKGLWRRLCSLPFVAGSLLFLLCPVISYFVLGVLDYSLYYALTALVYVFVTLLSHSFFAETIDARKLAGLALILGGLVLVSW